MSYKILAIDDEDELTQMVKSRLEASHYEVITASDGVEGMVKARDEKPDLIILDVVMPNLDGYTFIRELKQDREIKSIPIIVLTSRDHLQDLLALEGIDHDHYLLKPFEGEVLLEKISKILNGNGQKNK